MPRSFANSVSVFHFTNRISSAKIRKYTIATEKGMGPGGERIGSSPQVFPTPAPQVAPAGTLASQAQQSSASPVGTPAPDARSPTTVSSTPGDQPPPAKKPKLRLNGPRQPDGSPTSIASDTIAVSSGRPRRESSTAKSKASLDFIGTEPIADAASDVSSELSEPPSLPGTPPGVIGEHKPSEDLEYGDFSNFYIMDDGDGDDLPKPVKVKSPPKPAAPKVAAPAVEEQPQHGLPLQNQTQMPPPAPTPAPTATPAPKEPPMQIEFDNYGMHRQHPPPETIHQPRQPRQPRQQHPPAAARLPPPPPPPPPPQVQLIDFDFMGKSDGPRPPVTVAEMIKRLEMLSAALTNFGGVPSAPKSPGPRKPGPKDKKRKRADDPLDSFLGMFEDDSSGSDKEGKEAEEKPEEDNSPKLDYILQQQGESDGPLTYGIQFIQNALRSWAQQRLQHYYTTHHQGQLWAHQQQQPQKRGPGRPRKFTEGEQHQPQPPPLPVIIQIKADSQPEGVAIRAFQQVLDSGCLQVNAVLPQALTRALRHLYMQIDHLINQGAKSEPAWQCMSYSAQILANRARVEKHKENHAKAQEEMARQQQLAHQQVMQGMGLPVNQPQQTTSAQAQQQHQMDLERRRSSQHAKQQPYLSQHHLNPLLLGSQPPGTPAGHAAVPTQSPVTANPAGSPPAEGATPNGLPKTSKAATPNAGDHMSKIKMYASGVDKATSQMKFSFQHNNPQAVQVFGAAAFPGPQVQGPSIPNRGPMSVPPTLVVPSNGREAAKEAVPNMVVKSIEHNHVNGEAQKHAQNGDDDMEDVIVLSSSAPEVENVKVKKEAQPTPAPIQTSGFTAVNTHAQPSPATPAVNAGQVNGTHGSPSSASAYPHPGAVVVNE